MNNTVQNLEVKCNYQGERKGEKVKQTFRSYPFYQLQVWPKLRFLHSAATKSFSLNSSTQVLRSLLLYQRELMSASRRSRREKLWSELGACLSPSGIMRNHSGVLICESFQTDSVHVVDGPDLWLSPSTILIPGLGHIFCNRLSGCVTIGLIFR